MRIKTLRHAAQLWSVALSLGAWDITVKWSDRSTTDLGNTWWWTEERRAEIWLQRRQDDHEYTLVHELLHIVLEGHQPHDGKYKRPLETAINDVARALITFRRFAGSPRV